jgi:predicted RNA-binding Zn-ribbon protein involved in translation (DUF1610 family)
MNKQRNKPAKAASEKYTCPKCGHKEDDIDSFMMATDTTRSEGGTEYYCPKCDAKLNMAASGNLGI